MSLRKNIKMMSKRTRFFRSGEGAWQVSVREQPWTKSAINIHTHYQDEPAHPRRKVQGSSTRPLLQRSGPEMRNSNDALTTLIGTPTTRSAVGRTFFERRSTYFQHLGKRWVSRGNLWDGVCRSNERGIAWHGGAAAYSTCVRILYRRLRTTS